MIKDLKITGKCKLCKKEKATALKDGRGLCQRCWGYTKSGNEDLI